MAYIEFQPGEKHAIKGADISPMHETFTDCGYLLEDNEIVIDIDNLPKSIIEKLIQNFIISTQIVWTTKGCHMYFEKPKHYKNKSRFVCPLGFEIESFTVKQRPNGVTIKRDGKLRDINNIGKREPLPGFFKHIPGIEDMNGLDEGDGRNNKLHALKFKIMSVDNYKKILAFVNNHVFAEPLEIDEFNTVIRDEQIRAEKDGEYEVALSLIKKLKIVKYGDLLYSYDGTQFKADSEFKNIVASHLKGQKVRYIEEVIAQMKLILFNVAEPKDGFDVKFKNGILRNGQFWNIDSQEFTPHYVDWEYAPYAEVVPIVEEFLNTLTGGDQDYRQMILESIGHSLITNMNVKRGREFQKVILYVGDGGNGKGQLFSIGRKFLGGNNYSTVKLEQIHDEKYQYSTKGKLANFGDDIEKKPIKGATMSALKNATGYDEIEMRRLYEQPIKVTLTASHIYTSNHILKTNEKGESWKRRVLWCPMYNKPKKYDPNFAENVTSDEAMQYWTKLIVEAYFTLYKNRKFTISKVVQDFTDKYHFDNNSCIEFIGDYDSEDFIGKRPPVIFDEYKVWAEENGVDVQSKKLLQETIQNELSLEVGVKRVNGKTAKVYMQKAV
ncbi:phage/plasmid primase, P4 family [Bacillus sp. AFS088145]|uniref:phage/plasmid primase, P4 family n=1 Tax=Bacillus sp. AFS088145 TaxID=2033514 RepID=UPI000BF6E23C|nr:phage/plasmid primase, P4 family [Bacillus sp. AFS088145]PFH83607.1 DNA primase [Bacillus sp. AFS088145]